MNKEKILLELMYDFIEKILTPREYQIFTMYKNMKPRHIADKLGITSKTVRNIIYNLKQKIKQHELWLIDKKTLRGIA